MLAKFQELSDKLNEGKNSLNNMPGLLKFAEMLKNYQQEVRETESLSEAEKEALDNLYGILQYAYEY